MTDAEIEAQQKFKIQKKRATNLYGQKFVSELANEFGIKKKKQLRENLIVAATIYFEQSNLQLSAPTIKSVRETILEIDKLAHEFATKLKSLERPASELYWYPQRHLQRDLLSDFYVFSEIEKSLFGHRINRRTDASGAVSVEILKEDQIREAVCIASNLARFAVGRLKIDEGGHPRNEGLRIWILYMQTMWETVLKRRFTYDAIKGIGVTDAFRFCEKALKPLDSIPSTVLGTAMRAAIKDARAHGLNTIRTERRSR